MSLLGPGEDTFTPIRWVDGALELLDQRQLPVDETWVRCGHWRAVADAIRDMVVRGAPAIGIAAAYGLALAAAEDSEGDLGEAFAGLAATRPTAVNLFWAL
ncbi:MAG: S-methyl-5-thioribose-1-phosphate isomerase, partial [Myxococcales bacterium]|nr:S-methyl-5-thioribose-1-phosphate isomerase [Myxococcales bacterium]